MPLGTSTGHGASRARPGRCRGSCDSARAEPVAGARAPANPDRAELDLLQTALDFREAYALAVVDHERAAVMQAHQEALEELSVALRQLSKSGETAAYDVKQHEVEVRLHSRALTGTLARAERSE